MAITDKLSPKQIKGNTRGTVSPGVNDDSAAGYEAGSLWIDTVAGAVWACISAAVGAANWKRLSDATPVVFTLSNKNMTALATVADGDKACNTAIVSTPYSDGMVLVAVNGQIVVLKGDKTTGDCFFSGDGGTNARALADITAGDFLYWVGSVAGYELSTADKIDFYYMV